MRREREGDKQKMETSSTVYRKAPPSFYNSSSPQPPPQKKDKIQPAPSKDTIENLKKNYEDNLKRSVEKYSQRMKELAKNKRRTKTIF